MEVRLSIKSKKEGQQEEITLSGPKQFVLGRGPSSAALLDGPGISREHVSVSVDESDIFVADVSVNGTWINGDRLTQHEKRRVAPGDVVEIPGYEFVFQVDHASPNVGNANGAGVVQAKPNEVPSVSAPSRGPILSFINSFTFLDRLIIGLALISIVLVVIYVLSY